MFTALKRGVSDEPIKRSDEKRLDKKESVKLFFKTDSQETHFPYSCSDHNRGLVFHGISRLKPDSNP